MFYSNHSADLKLESGDRAERHTHAETLTDSLKNLKLLHFFILNKESRLLRKWHYILF
jgi:hypothetical protein